MRLHRYIDAKHSITPLRPKRERQIEVHLPGDVPEANVYQTSSSVWALSNRCRLVYRCAVMPEAFFPPGSHLIGPIAVGSEARLITTLFVSPYGSIEAIGAIHRIA